jgi:hypothetical protein
MSGGVQNSRIICYPRFTFRAVTCGHVQTHLVEPTAPTEHRKGNDGFIDTPDKRSRGGAAI